MYISKKSRGSFAYQYECNVLLCALSTVLIFLSLYSYNPHDPSSFFYRSGTQTISNYCGATGAQIAGLLIYFFGLASFLIIPLLFFGTYLAMQRRSWNQEWERIACFALLIITTSALCNVHDLDWYGSPMGGGYCGYLIASFLYRLVDYIGSIVILYASLHVCLVILFRFSFVHAIQQLALYGYRGVMNGLDWMRRHQVAWRSYYATTFLANYLMIKPIKALVQFSFALLEGNIFEGTQMRADEREPVSTDTLSHLIGTRVESHQNDQPVQTRVARPAQHVPELDITAPEYSVDIEQSDLLEDQIALDMSYGLPSMDIFIGVDGKQEDTMYRQALEERAAILEEKLKRFGVTGKVTSIKNGPVVTLFEYQPNIDTKLSKILALEDDLALALRALSIRIIAPIPGRSVVGFEVSNQDRKDVLLASVIQSPLYQDCTGSLPLILGEDTVGSNVIVDLAKMPHLLMAGSTGSGKSVALNAMLISLLCKRTPEELKLILIDPKRLEFAPYADIAHLLFPIITDPRRAAPVLRWVVQQMEFRYEKMAHFGARNIFDYNQIVQDKEEEPFPFIVVVIDELSDLMLTVGREIEDLITRITQMARAAGIHMIVATQRPSVDVITGLIKVNFPSRISFRVTSKADSRTILDCGGADKLLGRGDSLFLDSTASILKRVHGAYVSDDEINKVVSHIRVQQEVEYLDITQELQQEKKEMSHEDEQLFEQVLEFIQEIEEVSISLLQRKFRIGYNRSARIIDLLESRGLIMPADGGKARRIIR